VTTSPPPYMFFERVHMKNGVKLHELQAKRKEEELEQWVPKQPCLVCHKVLHAPYGRHEAGWTCSAKCEKGYEAVPRTGDRTPEC